MPNQDWFIIFKTKKEGNAPKELAGELKEVKKGLVGAVEGFTGMSIAGLGLAGVIAGVGKGLKDSMDETMAYAEQVRDLGRISGASAEDTSRLIQTADDLTVGYDTLQQAAKALAKDGIALTTEELAKSADEYLSYSDAGARAQYATDKFGKAGLELTKVLEQGGDAIRAMAEEQSDALILSQKQVDEARRLEKAEDALGDAFTGLKLTIGNAVIPVMADLLTGIDDLINAEERRKKSIQDSADTYPEYIAKMEEEYKGTNDLVDAHGKISLSYAKGTTAAEKLAREHGILTEAEWDEVQAADKLTEATALTKSGMDEFASSMGPNAQDVAGFRDVVQNLADKALADANAATKALANDAMEDLSRAFINQQIMATLTGDALLEYMRKEGLLREDTYTFLKSLQALTTEFDTNKDGVIDAYEAVGTYKSRLAELNGMKATITVETIYTTKGNPQGIPPSGTVYQGHGTYQPSTHIVSPGYWTFDAHGNRIWVPEVTEYYAGGGSFVIPPGYPNDSYPLGPGRRAESGEVVTVTPKGQGGGGSGVTIQQVIINNGMDMESFKRMLMQVL